MTIVPFSLGAKANFLVYLLWLLFQTVLARTSVRSLPPHLAWVENGHMSIKRCTALFGLGRVACMTASNGVKP